MNDFKGQERAAVVYARLGLDVLRQGADVSVPFTTSRNLAFLISIKFQNLPLGRQMSKSSNYVASRRPFRVGRRLREQFATPHLSDAGPARP